MDVPKVDTDSAWRAKLVFDDKAAGDDVAITKAKKCALGISDIVSTDTFIFKNDGRKYW